MTIPSMSPEEAAAWANLDRRDPEPLPVGADPFSPRFRRWQATVDRVFDVGASRMGLCGKDGREMTWSVTLAELFFVACPCCLWFRGLAVGFAIGVATVAAGVIAASILF